MSALLSYVLSDVQLNTWGWRVAFGIGLLIGPVGFYIRTQIDETPDFKKTVANIAVKTPLRDVLIKGHVSLLLAIGVVAGATAFNYVHKLYMPIYALKQLHIAATSSYLGALMTGITLMIMAPVFGGLSDQYGRFRVLTIALLITGFSSYPMFVLLNTFPSLSTLLMVQAIVGVLIAACLGPIPAMLAPFETRTAMARAANRCSANYGPLRHSRTLNSICGKGPEDVAEKGQEVASLGRRARQPSGLCRSHRQSAAQGTWRYASRGQATDASDPCQ